MKKRLPAVAVALAILLSVAGTVFASGTTTATVPVTLTVDNEYRAVNVTIPASLPIEVINGVVITANSAKITNNSISGDVQVTDVRVTNGAYNIGNYNNFEGSHTIALKINGCTTICSGPVAITPESFPVIRAGDSLPLIYFAKVSRDAPNAENVHAANVVFTISIINEQ